MGISLPKKLTNQNNFQSKNNSPLANKDHSTVKFKIALDHILCNNYQFKDLNKKGIREFSKFLLNTIGKNLTMTDVENTYMRTHKKPLEKEMINGEMQNVIHLGKDRTAFRIFGYYNTDDYFCIHRIDPNHQFYKSN